MLESFALTSPRSSNAAHNHLCEQEDKWKREQAALKEQQKAEELKKQILEEREREELDGLAHAAGIKQ